MGGGGICTTSFCGRCLCPYVLADEALQQKRTNQGRENNQLQDIQGQEGGRECLWDISGKVQGAADHHGAESKSYERHCVNMCGTTQHAEKPSGGIRQATHSSR